MDIKVLSFLWIGLDFTFPSWIQHWRGFLKKSVMADCCAPTQQVPQGVLTTLHNHMRMQAFAWHTWPNYIIIIFSAIQEQFPNVCKGSSGISARFCMRFLIRKLSILKSKGWYLWTSLKKTKVFWARWSVPIWNVAGGVLNGALIRRQPVNSISR